MHRVFPGAIKKLGFKQKEALFKKFEVDFIPIDTMLAKENEIPDLNHIQIVVKGGLKFYKRSEKFYDRQNQFGYQL